MSDCQGGASVQRGSANRKIAPQRFETARSGRTRNVARGPFVATTHVSIAATCPSSCPWRSGGCYAIAGLHRQNGATLDAQAEGIDADAVIAAEVELVDRLWVNGVPQDGPRGWGRALRLHVAGDVSSTWGARALSDAAKRWLDRGGGPVWTYTHRWRTIPRDAWPWISVLASVESKREAEHARRRGYVAAITVPEYPDGPRAFQLGSVRAVPCPAEVGRMTCAQCGLCFDDEVLAERGLAIAFAAHGRDAERVRLPLVR